jgi:hypothetical protein
MPTETNYGPIVMSTQAEIERAEADLRDGSFVGWRDLYSAIGACERWLESSEPGFQPGP